MKNNPFSEYQKEFVARRKKTISCLLEEAKHADFDSFNKLANHLAARLTAIEQADYHELYNELNKTHPEFEYNPPREASRQIFYRNEDYKILCDAFLVRKKISGSKSIPKQKCQCEHDIFSTEKELEISNLKAEVKRLKAALSRSPQTEYSKNTDLDSVTLQQKLSKITKEKSLTVQALISLMKWGIKHGLIEFNNGELIDLAFNKIIINKKSLKHCESAIISGLSVSL